MRLHSIDVVILDSDGTSFASEEKALDAYVLTASEIDWKMERADFVNLLGLDYKSFKMRIAHLYGSDSIVEAFCKRANAIVDDFCLHSGPIPEKAGFTELMRFLRENDRKVGLATSAEGHWVRKVAHDRIQLFDTVVCKDDVTRPKPAPDITIEILRRFNTVPERAIAIEDSEPGLLAHVAAGVKCIVVPDHAKISPDALALAEAVLPNLNEVKRYLSEH